MPARWPLRIRVWRALHRVVNHLAWHYARPPGPVWGIALRVDETRWLWRLNAWCAARWMPWWIAHTATRPADPD